MHGQSSTQISSYPSFQSSFGSCKRPSSDIGFIGDLIETIAHELVHARFPGLPPHGDEFNKRVRQVLNGKQFPWVIVALSKNDKSQATGEREEEDDNCKIAIRLG